tara:strand:- start:601 stop:873 length:273 start_codon:yes stop_codon:yes gene_type:complete
MSESTKHPSGFYVKKVDAEGKIPLDCPVCNLSIRDQQDIMSYSTYQCCTECKITWVEPNLAKWQSGWRPSEDKLVKYRENLLSRPSYLVN